MKRLLTLLAFLPLISAADFVPTFSNAWNIAQSTRESHRIDWYQASTVRRVYEFHFNNAPVSFPSNTVVTWDVVYATNQLLSLVATTGTISNADLGQVRFDLAPEESNLTEGNYIGYVKAWDVSVSPAKLITPLVRQAITVLFSTDSRYYDFVGPKTYTLGTADLGPGIVTPEILDRAYAETGTVAAIDLRLAALELEPTWSSASGSVWTAIQGKAPSSHQHTLSDISNAGSMAAEDVGDYQTIGAQTITYIGTNILWDVSVHSAAMVTLTNNARLAVPSGVQPGGRYTLRVIQDATGGRLLTYAGAYKSTGAIAPTLTSTSTRADLLVFDGISTTNMIRSGFYPDVR